MEENVSGKKISMVWMVCGVLIILLSLGADLIGIGSDTGIGWKQLLGAGVGVAVFLFGLWFRRVKLDEKK